MTEDAELRKLVEAEVRRLQAEMVIPVEQDPEPEPTQQKIEVVYDQRSDARALEALRREQSGYEGLQPGSGISYVGPYRGAL